MVEQNVAMSVGMNMLVGSTEPRAARSTMIASGIIVRPEVLSTRNVIWALDAVSGSGLISCNSFMAFNPNGVAALSRPRILALKFMMMDPVAGWSLGTSGNSL